MLVALEIIAHEIEQLQETLARFHVLDVDLQLPATQSAERFFQHSEIKFRLAAEVVVDHPGIAARPLDDAVDARAGKTVHDKFTCCGAQELLAAFRRIAPRASPRARRGHWKSRCSSVAVSHAGVLSATRAASVTASSSRARSLPRRPRTESPMGQPRRRPSGNVT